MKFQFILLTGAFLLILQIPLMATADVVPKVYYKDEKVGTFQSSGTFGDFNAIDEDLKGLAVAELLSEPPPSDQVRAAQREIILSKYFKKQSHEDQAEIYAIAFQLSLGLQNKEQSELLFSKATQGREKSVMDLVCDSFRGLLSYDAFEEGHIDPEDLKMNLSQVEKLIPFIQKHPNTGKSSCLVVERPISIYQMVQMASPALAKKLQPAQTTSDFDTQNLDSSCTEEQLKDKLFLALRNMKNSKNPPPQYVAFQEGSCKIVGLMKKTSENYEFHLKLNEPRKNKSKITFHSLAEAVQLMKSLQKPPAKSIPSANSENDHRVYSNPLISNQGTR